MRRDIRLEHHPDQGAGPERDSHPPADAVGGVLDPIVEQTAYRDLNGDTYERHGRQMIEPQTGAQKQASLKVTGEKLFLTRRPSWGFKGVHKTCG